MKNSFIVYTDYLEQLELLTMEQRGILLTALFLHQNGDDLPDMDGITKMAYSFIVAQIDRDNARYEETCAKRREAGKMGGRPKKANGSHEEPKKANGFFEKQTKAKKPDNDNDNDNENDNDNDNENENDNDTHREKKSNQKKERPIRHKYGEFKHVLLSDRDMELLQNVYDDVKIHELIKILDEAIETRGYKYKNHYLVLKGWVLKEYDRRHPQQQTPSDEVKEWMRSKFNYDPEAS